MKIHSFWSDRYCKPSIWFVLFVFTFFFGYSGIGATELDFSSIKPIASCQDNYGKHFMPLRPDLVEDYKDKFIITGTTEDTIGVQPQTVLEADAGLIPDGSVKISNSVPSRAPSLANPLGSPTSPQIGEKKNLVILIQFADQKFAPTHNQTFYQNMLFTTGDSLQSYFLEQSYGQLTINGAVLGPYTSAHDISYYAGDANGDIDTGMTGTPVNIYELTREAVQLAKNDANNAGFPWNDYDNDDNGLIDTVTIIHAGSGQEESNDYPDQKIWSHQWWISDGEPVSTGVKVYEYTMEPEDGQLGVFCHEFGHILGLPDLYDTDYCKAGAGKWDLMGAGGWNGVSVPGDSPAGLSAWCRHYLGWLNYNTPVQDQKDVIIKPTNNEPSALKLWTGGVAASGTYFLVENRQLTGFDQALPGPGLLIWWVNNPEPYITANIVNSQGNCRLIPIEADNLGQLWSYPLQKGDAGDPFPGSTGNTTFTCTSTPDSLGLNGAYTGVSLWNIHASSNNPSEYIADVTVKDGLILEPRTSLPSAMVLDGSTAEFNTVLLNNNTRVTVEVRDENNSLVRSLLNNNLVSNRGPTTIFWDGCDSNGEYVVPGSYVFTITASTVTPYGTPSASYSLPITTTTGISNKCNITGVNAPGNAVISGTSIAAQVDNAITAVTVAVKVSSNAAWKLYSDAGCTNELTGKVMNLNDGINTAYIRVTAQDAINTKIYTLLVTRAALVNVNANNTQVEVTDKPLKIVIPGGVTSATIAATTSLAGGCSTVTLPSIDVIAATVVGDVKLNVAGGTTVSGNTSWNGVINLPQIVDNSSVTVTPDTGMTAAINKVIEIGGNDIPLSLNRAVRILLPGQKDMDVGYYQNGTFTKITNTMSADNQQTGDALPANGDGRICVGNDLIIWTKHFTRFITYSQTAMINNAPVSFVGGGGGGGGVAFEGAKIGSKGGMVSDQGVTITIPAHAVQDDTQVKIEVLAAGLPPVANGHYVGSVYEISKDLYGSFNSDVTITFPLDVSSISQETDRVGLYWFDEINGNWAELTEVSVDYGKGIISGKTNHFTKFAVIAISNVVIPNDINNHWAKESIIKLVKAGVITGYTDGSFRPDRNISRAEFIVILVKAFKMKDQMGKVFVDTNHHWAREYIATATQNGVTSGYNDTNFGPDDLITREQMTVMTMNALGIKEKSFTNRFKDSSSISSWAQNAVSAANRMGIIKGYGDNSFRPQNLAQRAEAITVILNALNCVPLK